jgi:hypothetical protein
MGLFTYLNEHNYLFCTEYIWLENKEKIENNA